MRQIVALIVLFAIMVALIISSLLLVATPAHSAARPPCVGVVVRVINPGVDVVRRRDGSKCTRPSLLPVSRRQK